MQDDFAPLIGSAPDGAGQAGRGQYSARDEQEPDTVTPEADTGTPGTHADHGTLDTHANPEPHGIANNGHQHIALRTCETCQLPAITNPCSTCRAQ